MRLFIPIKAVTLVASLIPKLAILLFFGMTTHCHVETKHAYPSMMEQFSCVHSTIYQDGRYYHALRELGRGLDGVVFELISTNGQINSDLVLKLIMKDNIPELRKFTGDEAQLSLELPGTYTTTQVLTESAYEMRPGQTYFISSILKQRVNGLTADDLIFSGLSPDQARTAYESLLQFKSRLAMQVEQLAVDKDIFIWDFHRQNFMYDQIKQKWFLVDANREEGYEAFLNILKSLASDPRNHDHPIIKIHELFAGNWQKSRDRVLFEEYVDIYFKPTEDALRRISEANP